MTLPEFRDLLLTVTPNVYHRYAAKETGDYIVWQETGGKAAAGDNRKENIIKYVQVDLWTKKEYTQLLDPLIIALDDCDSVAVSEPVVDFDNDTKETRYIIECEVI